ALPNVTVTAAGGQAAVANDYCRSKGGTASSGQTILDQYAPSSARTTVDTFWLQSPSTGTSSDTAPTNQCWTREAVSERASNLDGGTSATPVPTTSTTQAPTTTTIPSTTATVSQTTTTTAPPPSPSGSFITGVSADHRSLVDQNGQPFLINGDS